MRALARRTMCAAAAALLADAAACTPRPENVSCLVATRNGNVHGRDIGGACAFLGVPFATAPVGALRWKPPQPARSWFPKTIEAVVAAPSCPIVDPAGGGTIFGTEDCLTLDVWTPAPQTSSHAPVIVWLGDGDFGIATLGAVAINPGRLAQETRTIVVSPNYRTGPLGFLAHPALGAEERASPASGNYGLLDQRAALAWVRDQIAAFGGDSASVTIAGRTTGGDSVASHLVSPHSSGYFDRALMQSTFGSSRWPTLAEAEAIGESFVAALGCIDQSQVVDCMRSHPVEDVLLALPSGQRQFTETLRAPWGPIVDGVEIPGQPRALYESGAFNRVPLIIGTSGDEGWTYVDRAFPADLSPEVFQAEVEAEFGSADTPAILKMYPINRYQSPKYALSTLASDAEATCEARRVARLVARTGTPVFVYSLETPAGTAPLERFGKILHDTDYGRFDVFAHYWAQFAATGDPNANSTSAPRWPAFVQAQSTVQPAEQYLVFGPGTKVHVRAWSSTPCDLWEPLFLRSVAGPVPAAQR